MQRSYTVDLAAGEATVLRSVNQWLGPARCSDAVARAIGFADTADLHGSIRRLCETLDRRGPLSALDWRRLLVSAEILFGSDVLGCGVDWPTVIGMSDVDSVVALRGLQRKLVGLVRGRPRTDDEFVHAVDEPS